jgi:hypothetical protein
MEFYGQYDVVVAGGGTSGVTAAICAARAGAKVLLVERLGALGGQFNVSGPPGFAYAHFFNQRGEQVIGGFMEETYNRLLKTGHALPHLRPAWRGSYSFSYVDPDWWGLMIFEMMTENKVELLLHSLAVEVLKEGNTVTGLVVENTSGRQVIGCKVLIDCTGEGDIAVRAGAPWEKVSRDQLQPHTISFTMDGVNWEKALQYIKDNPDQFSFERFLDNPFLGWTKEQLINHIKNIQDIAEMGEIMGYYKLRDAALAKGEWHEFSGVGFFLTPREGGKIQALFQHSSQVPNCDPNDVRDLTKAEIEARRQILIALKFIKKYMPGFENAYLTRLCPELRIRESRRIMGDYLLTAQDVVDSRKFKDVIGKSGFPSGGHHVASVNTLTSMKSENQGYPHDGDSHDIPYRSLVPLKVENLLVAGKHISTDRDAYHRFIQQTIVTGQAAGVAAALCVKHGITPRKLEEDVTELQKVLTEQGVILFKNRKA